VSYVEVVDVTADGETLEATVEYSRDLRRFFADDRFFVEYEVDVTDVHPGIRAIPVLAHVCPVAWTQGATVRTPVVDGQYLDSLRTVRAVLAKMYPSFVEGGAIEARTVAPTPDDPEATAGPAASVTDGGTATGGQTADQARPQATDAATLFTGGIDSLTTYVRHRGEQPALVNVQGWVIGIDEDERWQCTREHIDDYGRRFDVPTQFVRSNMLDFLDWRLLIAHFSPYHDGGWYSAVAGGLGLTGLAAPLCAAAGYRDLYVPATAWPEMTPPSVVDHWDGPGMPWGSHPDIENNVAWRGTTVTHDGFELSRQERVATIAEYARTADDAVPVRSCADSATATNCNECEKCFRTAAGLALAGVDPNDHGFEMGPADFERARRKLAAGEWIRNEHHANYWQDMRAFDPPAESPVDGAREFHEWLATFDAEAAAPTGRSLRKRATCAALRHVPYPLYQFVTD
jgi:hypothetical protein